MEINRPEYDKLKTVAVVLYTVPPKITFRDKPDDYEGSLLEQVARAATQGDGQRAATLAIESFVDTMNAKGFSYKILPVGQVVNSETLRTAMTNIEKRKEQEAQKEASKPMMEKVTSVLAMMGKGGQQKKRLDGAGPNGYPNFGMPYGAGTPLAGDPEESEYIKYVIQGLNVDGAWIITDRGMSFGCYNCIGGIGTASTQSRFNAVLLNREALPILITSSGFGGTNETAATASYIINPLRHEALFKDHGRKTAEVLAEMINATLNPKK